MGSGSYFFSKDLRLVPETREVMGHLKLLFGSGTSGPAKITAQSLGPPRFPLRFRLMEFCLLLDINDFEKSCHDTDVDWTSKGP